jgi:hypothetical protein
VPKTYCAIPDFYCLDFHEYLEHFCCRLHDTIEGFCQAALSMSNAAMVSQVSKERNKKIVQQPIDLLYRSEWKIRLCY